MPLKTLTERISENIGFSVAGREDSDAIFGGVSRKDADLKIEELTI